MKTSIATVSISGDLPEKLSAIAAAGFDGIEIFEQDFIAFDGSPSDVGRLVHDHGLEIMLYQPFRDFEGLPAGERTRAFERAKRKFDLMGQLGTDLILICSSVHPEALGGIDRMAEDLAELGALAATHDVRVGYEALAWGKYINDHRDAWEVVRRADHQNIGLIVDSFHTLSRKIPSDSIRSIPGDKIFFVQLADAPLIDMDLLYWSRHFRNMPGEGDLDIVAFMRAVTATGYQGPLSLEIFNDQFRGGSPKTIARDGYRSLLSLMDDTKRLEPEIAIKVPEMPPRISATGIEFIEFAANENEAANLGKILVSLGFSHSRQHINKSVSLWKQGDINIVINTEREGFAHSSYIAHGTSVCDIGLRVNNAADTVNRANILGAQSFEQPVGPGEVAIPAIRGVGGGVVHFLDETKELHDIWDIEFREHTAENLATEVGLSKIDHIAQTMAYEEMLTWSLFYTSIFELGKKPMVDVVDPKGLVRSQAIESPDGGLRITLNGTETHRTLAGHFISERFGSSVQHIAFNTNDIFLTSERLIDNKIDVLEIQSNYYDDLATRFNLSDSLISRLRELNILYDEENGAAFFQLYSKPYGEGLFFEIVQRDDGYDGYGAPNAPYRIAALRRFLRPAGMPRI